MSTPQSYATPAPRVEGVALVDARKVEAALAAPAGATDAAVATAASDVEPATTSYRGYSRAAESGNNNDDNYDNKLPTKVVRGTTGADLESYAAVLRGPVRKNILQLLLPCFYDERDFVAYGEVKYYVLVKDGLCYVYVWETDPSPLYAVELDRYTAVLEDPKRPDKRSVTVSPMPDTNRPPETMKTVLLRNKTDGKLAFQFTFNEEHEAQRGLAKLFIDLVEHSKSKDKVSKQQTSDRGGKAKERTKK